MSNKLQKVQMAMLGQDVQDKFTGYDASLAQITTQTVSVLNPPAPLVGAKGDGTTNDKAAIQAILDYAETNKRKVVFPSSSGDYMIDDTLMIGSNTVIEFTGSSFLKLSKYTSMGMIVGNKDNADNIVIINPLLDGGGNAIIVGSSGQNGFGFGNCGNITVIGGHIRNCARGLNNGDGGKGIQIENHNVTNFVAMGTFIEKCFIAISSHKDLSFTGGIKAIFSSIHAVNCENFAFASQTNGSDLTGLEHSVLIDNFLAENCGNTDGVFVLSRAANIRANGKIIGTNSPVAIIRGRHSRCKFDLEIGVDCTSVIDINPSTYSVDTGIAQENEYNLKVFGTYSYMAKSDTTGTTYPNRALQKSQIKGYATNDAGTGLIENNAYSLDTYLDMYYSGGNRFKGNTNYLVNYLGNKFATVDNFIIPTLQNGWINNDSVNTDNAGYKKDSDNYVYIQGLIKGGTNVLIFTLPPSFRPKTTLYYPVLYFDGANWQHTILNITPAGLVQLASTGLTINLLSIRLPAFKAEQ